MSFRMSSKKLVCATIAALLLACDSAQAPMAPTPTSFDPDLASTLKGLVTGVTGTVNSTLSLLLMRCTPQQYTKVTQQVGPSGGTIAFGNHTLVIPQGALSSTVTITAEALPEAGNAVRFGPAGLKFRTPAPLALSYANCSDGLLRLKLIVYTDDLLNILERLNTTDDQAHKRVISGIKHFSRYAVAW